ncbi:MAG: N-6 DNA methylase [Planctomycetaceae bacterium]|jgi:type I restriction-modification system DNA methylase subunit|nr:N-6 DNA methylase [Planctomycetaceae bacterium]
MASNWNEIKERAVAFAENWQREQSEAAELMGNIHDVLAKNGYTGHNLERFLVRILFCLFAEDAGIFEPNAFTTYIEQSTRDDGGDLGPQLGKLFEVLDTPIEKRQKNLDELLISLQYIDGGLFEETLRTPDCNRDIRNAILTAAHFDWSRISPAVFGSLFQSVMNANTRRRYGAHYTTEENIMKVIRPLFLDELRNEFDKIKNDAKQLKEFHKKLIALNFFDPACGCGNFLVLAYRELRLLEIEVLEILHKKYPKLLGTEFVSQVDVDQFYGIEIVEFPVRIAETALWLMDHQMNVLASERFGRYFVRLPLQKSATIVHANALRIDWDNVLPRKKCSYILGNPPYAGKKEQNPEQKEDTRLVLGSCEKSGILDYVSNWFVKAASYIDKTSIRVAFLSTNSISQGEQVGVLWKELFRKKINIHFAYRSFVWTSESSGKAQIHCVIIGFGICETKNKYLYYNDAGVIHSMQVKNISPYLIHGNNILIQSRRTPISSCPEIYYGSMMIDKDRGDSDEFGLTFGDEQRKALIEELPELKRYIRRFYGSEELINNQKRWCLWLVDAPPDIVNKSVLLKRRIAGVQKFRMNSPRKQTQELARTPMLFGEIRQPNSRYLLIPKVSSEHRCYIPICFMPPTSIASGSTLIIPNADIYHFGLLTSEMHMDWMRLIGGRMKSDYQYSGSLVYNNFPLPNPTDKQIKTVKEKAAAILEIRKQFPKMTLAELYNPLTMPPVLSKAHRELDRAVERCYRSKKPFANDYERLAFLFELYEKLTTGSLLKDQ